MNAHGTNVVTNVVEGDRLITEMKERQENKTDRLPSLRNGKKTGARGEVGRLDFASRELFAP